MLSRKTNDDIGTISLEQQSYILFKNMLKEDFLIKYYNLKILTKYIINVKHKRYIRTGEYPTLALLFEVEEK